MDLSQLFSALQATQEKKSTVRLSERNVIELVNKLKQLGILGDDLLHTINGKEYVTTQQLKQEVRLALQQAGGRIAMVELPALLGVDLVHCERQATALVAESGGAVIEAQGELISTQYFEAIASEINDMLQEAGQLSVSELALQYKLNTELLLSSVLGAHMCSRIQGRLEAGLLYTPAALRRARAQLRGALRGALQPCAIPTLLKELGADRFAGVSTTMVAQLVEELLAAGQLAGVLRGGGTTWAPAIYTATQQAALTAFYEQNGWVTYDTARRLGFTAERAHLQKVFPGGVALDSAYVSPTILAHLGAAVEEALTAGSWLDAGPLLPSALSPADVSALLERLPLLSVPALGQGKAGAGHAVPQLLAGSCVLSAPLMTALSERVAAGAREAAERALRERRASPAAATQAPKGASGGQGDADDDDWSAGTKKGGGKGGKAGGKGKGKAGGGKQAGGAKSSAAPAAAGVGVDEGWVAALLQEVQPDMDGAGVDGDLLQQLAKALMPAAVTAWQATLAAALTAGAEGRRQAKELILKSLDDAFVRLCLYASGAELFAPPSAAADAAAPAAGAVKGGKRGGRAGAAAAPIEAAASAAAAAAAPNPEEAATHATLERHLLKTTGGECLDLMLKWAWVEVSAAQGGPDDDGAPTSKALPGRVLGPSERAALMRSAPPDIAAALQTASDAAAAINSRAAIALFEEAAEQLGLRLRRPDKKSEKAGLATVRAGLLQLLVPEKDPAAALALVVPLLFMKATGHAITLPGKAISAVLAKAKPQLSEDHLAAVQEYHSLVVLYLKACGAPGGAPALAEALAQALPRLKALTGVQSEPTSSTAESAAL